MLEIPKSVREMQQSLEKSKQLMARLLKGQEIIEQSYKDKSIARIFEATSLFNKVAKELNDELEHALFMHECTSTGKTVLINRNGRPINVDDYVRGEQIPVDLWTLKSMKALSEVFGEENIVDVEFK